MEFSKSILKLKPCTSQKNHPTLVYFSLLLIFILCQQPYQLAISPFTFSTLKVFTFVLLLFLQGNTRIVCFIYFCYGFSFNVLFTLLLIFSNVVFVVSCVSHSTMDLFIHNIYASLIRSTCFSFNLLVMCVYSLSFFFLLCANTHINWGD